MLNSSQQPQDSVILGVDTHLEMHVGAIIDCTGKLLGTRTVETNLAGYQQLLSWAQTWGTVNQAGIEGTGTYGVGLTRFLIKKGIEVLEITRPDRLMRRQNGKSDPLDAECAARTVLAGRTQAIPKQQSGICEALRITGVARRSAVKAKTQAINQIRALLVSAPQDIRDALWKSNPRECVNACLMQTEQANSLSSQILFITEYRLLRRWSATNWLCQ
ncbi:transposase [Xenorhabdus sp. SGI246]|uniref:IS110 family transposase n=1 Tax=Xenorhabdus sp. SGI246 TaxID=3158263 RepID=UPI00349F81A9